VDGLYNGNGEYNMDLGQFLLLGVITGAIIYFGYPIYLENTTPYGDTCQAWRNPEISGYNQEHTCPSGYVCVPENKKEFCMGKYGFESCSAGTYDFSDGYTKENPVIGVCHRGLALPW